MPNVKSMILEECDFDFITFGKIAYDLKIERCKNVKMIPKCLTLDIYGTDLSNISIPTGIDEIYIENCNVNDVKYPAFIHKLVIKNCKIDRIPDCNCNELIINNCVDWDINLIEDKTEIKTVQVLI